MSEMNKLYNICMTLIVVIMTLCITYVSIHFNSWYVLFFLVLPAFTAQFLSDEKESKK